MNINGIDINKTAMLFFDILNIYYHGATHETDERRRLVVANAVRLRDAARKTAIPILFVQPNHRPDGATDGPIVTDTDMQLRPWPNGQCAPKTSPASTGSWEAQIIDELKPDPTDYIVPKFRWSAFYQTYLDLALRARGIDTIILSGGSTEIGIASTVYAARDMDYSFIIARDACLGSSVECHNMLMDKVFPRMARILSTDQVLEMMRRGVRV